MKMAGFLLLEVHSVNLAISNKQLESVKNRPMYCFNSYLFFIK